MNIDRMIIVGFGSEVTIRFKYYGEFDVMKWIFDDCKDDIRYIGNSNIDGAPIFNYKIKNIDIKLLRNFKDLTVFLRNFKIRDLTKNDLTKDEKSLLTFLKFFMNSDENRLIKGVGSFEISVPMELDDSDV